MKKNRHIIKSVEEDSIAKECGLEPGDILLKINEEEIEDVFDYRYLIQDEEITLLVESKQGEIVEVEIEKDFGDDLGIEFENGLMDEYRSCSNKCIFCFIDQMPPGMRETLYFKDDDARLSFLQGNYVTLTNMSQKDIDKIIKYHLEPINISFQTMNKELRCKMLNNRFAGDALDKAKQLFDASIAMNGQIVLCKGVNDGKELEYSIEQLTHFIPVLESVSVVPVGLSKFREGLYPLEPFCKKDAKQVLSTIHKWQQKCFEENKTHFIHAGDEWYLLAEEEIPEADNYDGYLQLENGVGMMRLFLDEFKEAFEENMQMDKKASNETKKKSKSREISIATGKLAYPMISQCAEKIMKVYPKQKIYVYEIQNNFFGEQITVAGLITGSDLMAQLKGKKLGNRLILPECMLRSNEDVFLDDYRVSDLEKALQVPIDIVKSSGREFVNCILN